VWILIPMMALSIPIIAILVQPFQTRMKILEREKLRQMYERLALEKLDVIKTAVAMGYKQSDLAELDSRLEQVIGSDAMQRVLEGKSLGKSSGKDGAALDLNTGSLQQATRQEGAARAAERE
jgi:microcystin degradation protein MlrC